MREAFAELSNGNPDIAVAVRSATLLKTFRDASFAGQQETFLNIRGIDNVLIAIKEVFALLFNDRAIVIVYTKVLIINWFVLFYGYPTYGTLRNGCSGCNVYP